MLSIRNTVAGQRIKDMLILLLNSNTERTKTYSFMHGLVYI